MSSVHSSIAVLCLFVLQTVKGGDFNDLRGGIMHSWKRLW